MGQNLKSGRILSTDDGDQKGKSCAPKSTGAPAYSLIPLYGRAVESQKPNGLLFDSSAVERVAAIDNKLSIQ